MKTINDIHSDLIIFDDLTSMEACEMIGKWCDRSAWAVYKWLEKPPDMMIISHVNAKYFEYMGEHYE